MAASRHQRAPVRRREAPGLQVSRNDSALLLKGADLAAAQRILEEKGESERHQHKPSLTRIRCRPRRRLSYIGMPDGRGERAQCRGFGPPRRRFCRCRCCRTLRAGSYSRENLFFDWGGRRLGLRGSGDDNHQYLGFPPGWAGEQSCEGSENGHNGIRLGEHGWTFREKYDQASLPCL